MTTNVREVDASSLAHALTGVAAPILLDVRHDWEVAQGALPGALHVPLAALLADGDGLIGALPGRKDAPLVTYCHHGVRSAKAAQVLAELGYTQVMSLRGGIDAWSCDVDATLPRY